MRHPTKPRPSRLSLDPVSHTRPHLIFPQTPQHTLDTPVHTPIVSHDDHDALPAHWPFLPAPPLQEPVAPRFSKRCAQHVHDHATTLCTQCGNWSCSSCTTHDTDGLALCTKCDVPENEPEVDDFETATASSAAAAAGLSHTLLPFEDDASSASLFTRLLATIRLFLIHPPFAFALLKESSSLTRAALLCYLCTFLGTSFNVLWPYLADSEKFMNRFTEALSKISQEQNIPVEQLEASAQQGLFFALPFFPLFQICAGLFVFYIFTRLLGGVGKFRDTFLVYAYASIAQLFFVLPLIGWPISIFFLLTIQIAGLRVLHNMTPMRAAVASMLSILTMHICGGLGAF